MRRDVALPGWLAIVTILSFAWAMPCHADAPLVVKAAVLHVGDGTVLEQGMIVIEGGKITAVGVDLPSPAEARVIHVQSGEVTPGLIDAHAEIDGAGRTVIESPAGTSMAGLFASHQHDPSSRQFDCCGSSCQLAMQHLEGQTCPVCGFPDAPPSFAVGTRFQPTDVESSSEVIPHTRVLDALDLRSPDFDRLLHNGVTTVFAAADSAAVISSRGAVLRTGGPMKDRVIREADAVLAAMGTEPSRRGASNQQPFGQQVNFYARRPTTRMGVAWVFRKAMHDAERFEKGLPVSGADTPSEAALVELVKVRAGSIPLRVQARTQHDILTALRLANEFDLAFTLVEATESYRCQAELQQTNTPVIFGPIYVNAPGDRSRSGEVGLARLHTFESLLKAGIPTALTAHELRDEAGLARQAMYARRFGIPLTEVLRSVTETPADLLGLQDQVGTISVGKQADLVVWDGEPFDGVSQPAVVILHGQVALDKRPK